MKPALGAFNRISLFVFWLRASLISLLLLLLPVSHYNNWSGGYGNPITFPSTTDPLCTPVRPSGGASQMWADEIVEKQEKSCPADAWFRLLSQRKQCFQFRVVRMFPCQLHKSTSRENAEVPEFLKVHSGGFTRPSWIRWLASEWTSQFPHIFHQIGRFLGFFNLRRSESFRTLHLFFGIMWNDWTKVLEKFHVYQKIKAKLRKK